MSQFIHKHVLFAFWPCVSFFRSFLADFVVKSWMQGFHFARLRIKICFIRPFVTKLANSERKQRETGQKGELNFPVYKLKQTYQISKKCSEIRRNFMSQLAVALLTMASCFVFFLTLYQIWTIQISIQTSFLAVKMSII